MAAPIWIASPPEVHSALLSAGPGPGPLLAAAGAWNSLSTEYAAAAQELGAALASVQAGAWRGPSAASYTAAHAPYLAWLTGASAASADRAARHETAAAAYTAALATMPTLPELAANHVVHGMLVATNFFGVNTIPIALNEADYARMWVQAATTMSTYDAVSTAALASAPQTAPSPQIVKSDASKQDSGGTFTDPTVDNPLDDFIANILKNFGINWDPAEGTVNGLPYDAYTNAGQPLFWVVRALELFEDFQQFGYYLVHNPALAFQYLVQLALFDWPTHILEIFGSQPELLAPAIIAAVAPFGAIGAFAGLAGLTALPQPAVVPATAPAAAPLGVLPVVATAPTAVAPTAAAAPAPAPAPAPTATATAAGPAPPPSPPATGAPGFFPPYVVGPPGLGAGAGLGATAAASAKRKAPEPDSAAAAAAASAREAARERRRKRARRRGQADEFADMHVDVDPDWGEPPGAGTTASSERGAGNIGFAGTAPREGAAEAAGLTTLAGDEFSGGPRLPMLPGSWDPEGGDERGGPGPSA
ncbi:PPE family protein [Mycobacterium sp. 663a-19]|uniref:PPE family protein n=1 Tax=Mycobacterium sp. 663a-19 TaxID=2986148 RepID=UPI002D1EA1A1|nr:PPE family protein [Mycobacterium sp. 663a-19]MEB3984390.1 PPE family protein [Mycobacterium sp. 663a-19]